MRLAIVIPGYNCGCYVKKCIDSVLCQEFKNYSIFFVDDGSSDSTAGIVKSYNDSRIIYIWQPNSGVSAARNRAINAISERQERYDYIMFMDADDWLEKGALSKIFMESYEHEEDYIFFNWNEYHCVGNEMLTVQHKISDSFSSEVCVEDIKKHFLRSRTGGSPWGKLFKTEIIKNNIIRFDVNLPYAEDYLFNLEYLNHANTCFYINEYLYGYNCCNEGGRAKIRRNLIDITSHVEQRKYSLFGNNKQYKRIMDAELIERTAIGILNLKNFMDDEIDKREEIGKAIGFLLKQEIGTKDILISSSSLKAKFICLLFYEMNKCSKNILLDR
ncbi:glycosyltransferase family 2 protein [Butyrivibrio sp. INlla14]|uniref:glycosyltransferase family 2 protein n=1 Tax=Butyrivibrio sp. INlla14 TaxID=1520808 RepID=UPI000876C846|nr:glycosyltransferase family A protein [Butyrivibrio sp. INlla14]SCY50788.1 Glycosyl transferase family 2 [Butyrivibrio sp. INlla14]